MKKLKAKNHEYPSDCSRSVQSSLAASHPELSSHMTGSPIAHSITTDSHTAHVKRPPPFQSGLSYGANIACFFVGGSAGCSGSRGVLHGVGNAAGMMQLSNLALGKIQLQS